LRTAADSQRVCLATCRFSPPSCSLAGTECSLRSRASCGCMFIAALAGIVPEGGLNSRTRTATEGTAARILSVYRGILHSPFAKYPASEDLVLLPRALALPETTEIRRPYISSLSLSLSLSLSPPYLSCVSSISEEINRNDYAESELAARA